MKERRQMEQAYQTQVKMRETDERLYKQYVQKAQNMNAK